METRSRKLTMDCRLHGCKQQDDWRSMDGQYLGWMRAYSDGFVSVSIGASVMENTAL